MSEKSTKNWKYRKNSLLLRNFPAGSKEIKILSHLIALYLLDRKRKGKFIPRLFTCISFHSLSIHLYLFHFFVNPNSRLSLAIPFSLSISICCISTYICFYPLSIHLNFFISLFQSRLMPFSFNLIFCISANPHLSSCTYLYLFSIHHYLFLSLVYPWHISLSIPFCKSQPISLIFTFISFYLFVNPNSRLSLSIPFSLSIYIRRISTYICSYLLSIHLNFFISLFQSRLMPFSYNPIFFISA